MAADAESPLHQLAEAMWNGDVSTAKLNPVKMGFHQKDTLMAEVAPDLTFVLGFANVTIFHTTAGLVLVDTGSWSTGGRIFRKIRKRIDTPCSHIIYTHGHVDHVFGTVHWDDEAEDASRPLPTVIAHESCSARFDRYRQTAGYNGTINMRQFSMPDPFWPTDYRYPDETFSTETKTLVVGDTTFELHHDRGETDDGVWVWEPKSKTLCTGDLFIWACPNCGNPQKVQRYAKDWAAALRKMEALGADRLLPGHGPPIFGADRVSQALSEAAELLESIVDQTINLMNQGLDLNTILHTVSAPAHLLARPYLRPIYDEPEFIVRNLWRLYGGWYDGHAPSLHPPKRAALAAEIATLAGGPSALAARADALAARDGGTDDEALRLAGTLVEMAVDADPRSAFAHEARARVYEAKQKAATSLMAKGIYGYTARSSHASLESLGASSKL